MSFRDGVVYFLHAAAAEAIKIGYSSDLKNRLASIRTASPVPLELIGTRVAPPREERWLHVEFAHLRIHGEWFHITQELWDFIHRYIGGAHP